MKKIWIICICFILVFALTACQQISQEDDGSKALITTTVSTINSITATTAGEVPATTTTTATESTEISTTTSTEDGGTGGDLDSCEIHQFFYHAITGNWTDEHFDTWIKAKDQYASREDRNIIAFVQLLNIPREDFPRLAGWTTHKEWDGDLNKPALSHYKNCPYTYNQFLDAIYGDDAELTEWVFAAETVEDVA